MARGPIATERLSESFPNLLIYKMKTPWRDGTTHVSFSYLDLYCKACGFDSANEDEFSKIPRGVCTKF